MGTPTSRMKGLLPRKGYSPTFSFPVLTQGNATRVTLLNAYSGFQARALDTLRHSTQLMGGKPYQPSAGLAGSLDSIKRFEQPSLCSQAHSG